MTDKHSVVRTESLENGVVGIEVELPNAPPLLVLRGRKGFIMCGYLDISVAEKLGLIAARVVGVSSIEEMLEKEIVEATEKARSMGVREGMKVREALRHI